MIIIAGPCVLESETDLRKTAETLKQYNSADFYLKASCIKDNRTTMLKFYGYGFEQCIPIFTKIKQEFGVKITTDFHSVEQIQQYAQYFDLIQIPAFLARQISILQAAAQTGKKVHIKKPQFTDPHHAYQLYNILRENGCEEDIFITDRGTQFGYDTVMMDPRHIQYMKESESNIKVLVDITHPNKGTLQPIQSAEALGMAYIAAGVDGIFMETHPCPEFALCDADTQILLEKAPVLLDKLLNLKEKL